MLKALEVFWLSLSIFCIAIAAFFALRGAALQEVLFVVAAGLISGLKYVQRRSQRIKKDKGL